MPTLFIVAGPNGCGKSTLTRTGRLPGAAVIDPDAIMRISAPGQPVQAAREALRRRREALRARTTHLVETTLAGSGVLRHMEVARGAGYRTELHFVCLDTVEAALGRIRTRVSQGGHDVPEPEVRRRFARSLANLPAAIALADAVCLYDNTSLDRPYRAVAIVTEHQQRLVGRPPGWAVTAAAHATAGQVTQHER